MTFTKYILSIYLIGVSLQLIHFFLPNLAPSSSLSQVSYLLSKSYFGSFPTSVCSTTMNRYSRVCSDLGDHLSFLCDDHPALSRQGLAFLWEKKWVEIIIRALSANSRYRNCLILSSLQFSQLKIMDNRSHHQNQIYVHF
jgi:hypothetical protein